jgi:glycolate oxidase FAD binding subunit
VIVPPSKVAECVQKLATTSQDALIHAHGLNGIIWFHPPEGSFPVDSYTIRRCPAEEKKSLPVWGKPSVDWELMRHVKKTLDPDNVFNPGRLFADV